MGNLVAIRRTQLGPGLKLQKKFLGPYRVTKTNPNDRYKVEKIDGEGPQKTTTAADSMKIWKNSSSKNNDQNRSGRTIMGWPRCRAALSTDR